MRTARPTPRPKTFLPNVAKLPAVTATDLKNKLGEVLGGKDFQGIAVTRHDRPEFVVLPAAAYESMMQKMALPLAGLTAEFDELVARMNTPKAKNAYDALFEAAQAEIGKATAQRPAPNG